MSVFCRSFLLLALIFCAGCAAQTRTMQLPPQTTAPLVAQFGARLTIAGQTAPVQGEVQMTEIGGSLALILPHGRTLGICRYSMSGGTEQPVTRMECAPAEGMGAEAARLLVRAGVAVYRILPALSPDATPKSLNGKGWSVRFTPAEEGSNGVYTEQDGMTMDLHFVEISRL